MIAATREFIDDTYVHKSVQKSKNDKLPSSQKSRLRLTINEDNKKVAVKTTRMRSYHLIITEVKLKLIAARAPCDVFDPWVRWERGQVGI